MLVLLSLLSSAGKVIQPISLVFVLLPKRQSHGQYVVDDKHLFVLIGNTPSYR